MTEPLTPERISELCLACGECCRGQVLWTAPELGANSHPDHDFQPGDHGSPLMVSHGGCGFFDQASNACTIHDQRRPKDCETFPISFYLQDRSGSKVTWTVADCPLGREVDRAFIVSAQARLRQMWANWTAEELVAYLHTPSQHKHLRACGSEPATSELTEKYRSVTHRLNVWRFPGMHAQLVGRLLHEEVSDYQKIKVLDTAFAGKCLFLDGVIQLSEKYWAHTHESIVVPALSYLLGQGMTRLDEVRALVLGGGDLGVASLLLDMGVSDVITVEIDPHVTATALKYWPDFIAPRAVEQVIYADAFEWVVHEADLSSPFDLIFCDMPNATGPAASLHSDAFLTALLPILMPDGFMVTHAESPDFQPTAHARALDTIRKSFPQASPYRVWIPPYLDCWCRVLCPHPDAPWSETLDGDIHLPDGHPYQWATPKLIASCFNWMDA